VQSCDCRCTRPAYLYSTPLLLPAPPAPPHLHVQKHSLPSSQTGHQLVFSSARCFFFAHGSSRLHLVLWTRWFQVAIVFFFFAACGFSITLGYHRMFSHLAFQGHPIVKGLVLFFGAGAFENSALMWCTEHRTHHKHVDHDEDPYSIRQGDCSMPTSAG